MAKKKFWQFVNQTEESAELLIYGDISDTSWWGDEVTPKQFAEDLRSLGDVKDITVSKETVTLAGTFKFAPLALFNSSRVKKSLTAIGAKSPYLIISSPVKALLKSIR